MRTGTSVCSCLTASGSRTVSCEQRRSRIFFFQAEDGIRDVAVTGVQTCALPISDLDNSGSKYQILKVKTNEGIFLEVYGKPKSGSTPALLASTKLPDKKDGYFTFKDRKSVV